MKWLLRLLNCMRGQRNFLQIAAGWIGILFLVPAMVIVSLYSTSWVLNVIPFQVGSMKIADLQWPVVMLIAATSALFFTLGRRPQKSKHSSKSGAGGRPSRVPNTSLIVALLASGLLLLPVDRMGMGTPGATATSAWGGYPDEYKTGDAHDRLKKIEREETVNDRLGFMRQLYDLIYSRPLSTARAKSFIALANLAADRYKNPDNNVAVQKRIEAHSFIVSNAFGMMLSLQPCWTEARSNCERTVKRQFNELNAEVSFLRELRTVPITPAKKFELAATATAAVKVELDALERQMEERIAFVRSVPYLIVASIAFILAMYVVGFRSWAMAILGGATILATGWSVWPFAWSEWADYFIVLYPLFVGAVAGFLWRFLFRAYQDNKEILNALTLPKLLLTGFVARVLIAALPFYGIIYLSHWVSQAVYDELSAAIYCESSFFDCGSTKMLVYDTDPTRDTLRDDVNAGVQRLFLEFEVRAFNAASDAPSLASATISNVTSGIMALFNDVLPGNLYDKYPDLKPPSCGWFLPNLKCFARKIALERLNAAYRAPRNRLQHTLQRALGDVAAKIRNGVAIGSSDVKRLIQGKANEAAGYVTRTVDASFISLNALAVAHYAFALLVVMRALALIAGRTLYGESRPRPTAPVEPKDSEGSALRRSIRKLEAWTNPYRWPSINERLQRQTFPLTHDEAKAPVSKVSDEAEAPDSEESDKLLVDIYHEEYELRAGHRLPLLVKRKYDVDDAYKVTALVRSRYHQWPVRRLMNGCLILRWAWCEEGKSAIRFSGPPGSRFVVWRIPKNRRVFFRWNEFVAMSASATLKKTLSLRLGTLMTGSVMIPSVVGPGVLIQLNRGISEDAKKERVPPSIYPHRLISWEAGTDFRIRSPRGILSLYWDPPSLEPEMNAQAVIDTDGGSSYGVGLLKELYRLVRP